MDTAQWPQEIVVKPMEEIVVSHNHHPHGHGHIGGGGGGGGGGVPGSNNKQASSTSVERKVRPQKDQALNCPRCSSTNTKFCYYNNYSLTQPRYFCKTCRRYWTAGGSLRNIPVGGGSRKNKRVPPPSSASSNINNINNNDHINNNSSSSCSNNAAAAAAVASNSTASRMMGKLPNLVVTPSSILPNHPASYQNPKNFLHHREGLHDLNLGFSTPTPVPNHHQEFRGLCDFIQLPSAHMETATAPKRSPPSATTTANNIPPLDHNHHQHHHHHHPHPQLSALELITGLASSRGGGLASLMPMPMADPNSVYSSAAGGFQLQHPDFKPTLSFTLDGGLGGGGYEGDLRDSLGDQRGASNDNSNNNNASDNRHNNINGSAGTGRFLFPFEDLKQRGTRAAAEDHRHDIKDHRSSSAHDQQQQQQQQQQEENREREATAAGYWRGMLLGGTAAGTAAGSSW